MNDFLKKYWWCIIIIVFAPIAINYLLLIPAIGPVVGNNVHWLSFWGSYLAALIPTVGAFMILYIQRNDSTKENDKRRTENEQNRQLQMNVLKYQQEMQWLNEKREILVNFVLTLSRDNLIELANKMGNGLDILQDVKSLLGYLVKNDSQVGFMRVSVETDKYKEFDAKRKFAYYAYRDALLDLQEICMFFIKASLTQRNAVFVDHLRQNLIHRGLLDVVATYPNESVFLSRSPHEIAIKLIFAMPDLLEDTRKIALDYIKSEEERIKQLFEEN